LQLRTKFATENFIVIEFEDIRNNLVEKSILDSRTGATFRLQRFRR
jgi:hypothetical protein